MDFPDERQSKRRKLERIHGPPIKINQTEDLQNALVFRKSSSPEVKKGILAFKDFLGGLVKTESVAEQSANVRLLKQYCDSQSPEEENAVAFPDLIFSWSYAGESNNDPVLSAIPAVLAQFLRLVSSYLEFRDFGLSLCKSLLQKDQIKLFERAFSSSKSKEHLISPCLRLLTEIIAFDGGAMATQLYARKDILFKRLELFLEQTATKDDLVDRRAPKLRRIAQRYVIANLRLQSTSIKADLVGQGKILHALLKGIERDGDDIVIDILQVLQRSILSDTSLHKKSRFLNMINLQALLPLYNYEEVLSADLEDNHNGYIKGRQTTKVRTHVHEFFLAAIQPDKGVLLPQNGWYPQGIDPDFFQPVTSDVGILDLGVESPLHFDEYREKIPVKNGTLSAFVQSLKPETDDLQAALLLKIFEYAPELVADFFSKTKRFSSKPKDDPEWRAQSAFLFSVVQLPVPRFCGWDSNLPQVPPPISIVIESILPRAFPQADLTRCMNLAHEIITLFAAKYATASLQKLTRTLQVFRSASTNELMWKAALERLVQVFSERIVSVKDVIVALKRAPKDNEHISAALIECLATYSRALPQHALSEKFDVAAHILDTIRKLESDKGMDDSGELLLDQLRDLSVIAERSTEVKWWHKPEAVDLSPFLTLLKVSLSLDSGINVRKTILRLLKAVVVEAGITESDGKAFEALISSLASTKAWSPDQNTYSFLDNCMSRVVRQPIKYLEQLEKAQASTSEKSSLSLLACCISEQWSFVAKADDKEAQENIALWIARIFDAFATAGGNFGVLTQLQQEMLERSSEKAKSILHKAIKRQQKKPISLIKYSTGVEAEDGNATQENGTSKKEEDGDLDGTLGPLPSPPTTLEGLTKWKLSDLETDIQSLRLARLIRCTTSPLEEVRIQTFTSLQSLLTSTRDSTHPDAQRLHLLLGELLETIKLHTLSQPLPTVVSSMTTLLLRILTDPSDKMYGKTNRFLLRSPRWDVAKLPSYWITQTLLREADDDDCTNLEIDRLLVMLGDGLTTEADMELYRRNAVFERVLSLWWSPHVLSEARRKICLLVWRGWQTGRTGRMTLLTRCGVAAWVDAALLAVQGAEESRILQAFGREIRLALKGEEGTTWKEGRSMVGKKGRGEDSVH